MTHECPDTRTVSGSNYYMKCAGCVEREKQIATLRADLVATRAVLDRRTSALRQIAEYGHDGICPYGCDAPNIASSALAATLEAGT